MSAQKVVEIVWADISTIKEEVEADKPSKLRLENAAQSLQDAMALIAKWCGGKLDKVIDETIKWGTPAILTYFAANSEAFKTVIELAKAYARTLG